MTNLETSLTKHFDKRLVAAFLILSFIGFLDAAYLASAHYAGLSVKCFINGCEAVLTSQYAAIAGIPVALLGAIYYLIIFIFIIAYLDFKKEFFMNFAVRLAIVGFIVSLLLMSIQIFIIKALCLYCFVSFIIFTILFVSGLFILNKNK